MKSAAIFTEKYGGIPAVFRSPGRINVLGEHTDYNEGFVLPAAINMYIEVAVSLRNDDQINIYSVEYDQEFTADVKQIGKSSIHWVNYPLGVIAQFINSGRTVPGFSMVVDGNIPIGSGLSSSAAFETAVAYSLNELCGFKFTKKELAQMAQKAEHEYAGVQCGIMDQFACLFGKKEHLILLDCRSLDYRVFKVRMTGFEFLLLNSNVKHSLASSAYNERRAQCHQGVQWLNEKNPYIHSLRDATLNDIEFIKHKDELIYRRCHYVISENMRTLEICDDLMDGKMSAAGKKMFETHLGLSKEYEVSCDELDFLVNEAKKIPSITGARMMGGGFGGCMLLIVRSESIPEVIQQLGDGYVQQFGKQLTPYSISLTDGTSTITNQ